MAELLSLTSLYVLLGVLAGLAVLGAIFWAARRATGAAKDATCDDGGKRQGLLNKENDAVVIDVVIPGDGGVQQEVPEAAAAVDSSSRDVQLCAICKGPLGKDEGPCRRLWPCRHEYHAECIDLWLDRKRICPLCRAAVVVARTETVDAMV